MTTRSVVGWAIPALLLFLGLTSQARGQTLSGPFISSGPNVAGVAVVPSGGTTFIDVDDDGDVLTPPVRYNLSSLAPDLVGRTNYFLSPSRTILYVLQVNVSMGMPPDVWFARLDGAGTGIDLLHGPIVLGTPTPASTQLFGPAWYDAPGGQQIAYFVVGTTNGFDLELLVVDMNTVGLSGQVRVGLRTTWQSRPQPFSQAGDFMVIQSDVVDSDLDGNTDFVVVGLCDDQFGANTVVERPNGSSPTLSVDNVASGTADVVFTEGQAIVASVTFDDCFADPDVMPPARGACCIFGGVALLGCFDNVTASECSNYQAQFPFFQAQFNEGMTCDEACPTASIEVSAVAASSIVAPGAWTIRFDLTNTSNADATNIRLDTVVPQFTTFVDASDGGVPASTSVTWLNLGPIPAGTTRSVTMTVGIDCSDAGRLLQLFATSYNVLFDAMTASGLNDVSATVVGPDTDPVDITVTSTPDRVPLLEGDRVRHTITLSSPNGVARPDMLVNSSGLPINAGQDSLIDQMLNDGGGTFTNNFDTSFSWEGTIPATGSVTIELMTRVTCIRTDGEYQLAFGSPITVQNACRTTVGTAFVPSPIPTTAPLSGNIAIVNPQPGLIGPVTSIAGSLFSSGNGQLIRDNEAVVLEFTVTNAQPAPLPMAIAMCVLPDAFVTVDPPFIGTPPAGFAWDNTTRTLSFNGPLATGESAVVTIDAVFQVTQPCIPTVVSASLETGAGCGAAFTTLSVWEVPLFPDSDRLYAADPFFDGIAMIEINNGVQGSFERFFCTTPEIYTGLAVTDDGTLFMAGLPAWEINPNTLELRLLGDDVFSPGIPNLNSWIGPNQVIQAPGTDRVFYSRMGSPTSGDLVVALEPGQPASTAYVDPATVRLTTEVAMDAAGSYYSVVDSGTSVLVLPTGAALPAPAGSGIAIPVPTITYPALASLGPVMAQSWLSIGNGPGGAVIGTVGTTFGVFPESSAVDALVRINGDGTVDVLEPLWAGGQAMNAPPLPAGTSFAMPARGIFNFAPDGADRLYVDSFATGLLGYDTVTGLVTNILGAGNEAGIAYFIAGSGCAADWDGDETVDVLDLLAFLALWYVADPQADLTGDGTVGVADLVAFLGVWFPAQGAGC